ncbi:MAG TPA: hypothetical protein VMZ03_10195 [Chitinophagaceae bacterium]|nr:hypothetical protein [Chitinophagaceae bacterium]
MGMRKWGILFFLLLPAVVSAQHCPWDCSGLLMIQTNASPAELKKIDPLVVDGNKEVLVDSIYGTGKETADSCRILFYDDFLAYRTERTKIHHWYGYDTLFYFAKDHFVARFNFCRYDNKQLFIRFNDLSVPGGYSYIEIPDDRRIHLHEYNTQIRERRTGELLTVVQPFIMKLSRYDWKLPDK